MSLATFPEQPRPLAQRDDPAGPLLRRLCELDVAICVVPLGRLGPSQRCAVPRPRPSLLLRRVGRRRAVFLHGIDRDWSVLWALHPGNAAGHAGNAETNNSRGL